MKRNYFFQINKSQVRNTIKSHITILFSKKTERHQWKCKQRHIKSVFPRDHSLNVSQIPDGLKLTSKDFGSGYASDKKMNAKCNHIIFFIEMAPRQDDIKAQLILKSAIRCESPKISKEKKM